MKQVVFTAIKPGKFESVPTSSELQAANLGILQVAIGEARDTLMNPSPICYERIIIECGQSKKTSKETLM